MGMDLYQRSVQRAGLHAWVVAATAVAAIGMPGAAVAVEESGMWGTPWSVVEGSDPMALDLTGAQLAGRSAGRWLADVQQGRVDAALEHMLLPRAVEAERAVAESLEQWAAVLSESDGRYTLRNQRQAGHWGLTLWGWAGDDAWADTRVMPVLPAADGLLPIVLYNPAGDDLTDPASQWSIVPRGHATDPALAPLFNADYHELLAWNDRRVLEASANN